MENKFRNEMEIELAGQKILLRPTFENLAATESKIGSLPFLAFKYGKGVEISEGGSVKVNPEMLPAMSEIATLIYLNQAEKKHSQESVMGLCLEHGLGCARFMLEYVARCTAGNKFAPELSAAEKKT